MVMVMLTGLRVRRMTSNPSQHSPQKKVNSLNFSQLRSGKAIEKALSKLLGFFDLQFNLFI